MTKRNPPEYSWQPLGLGKLSKFCAQVEAGEIPDRELLILVAGAFRAVLAEPNPKKRPAVFMQAMRLQKSKGRKQPRAADEEPRFKAVLRIFLADPEAENLSEPIGDIAEEFDVDVSTVRRWVRKHRESAQPLARQILSKERQSKG